ncbi:MAG: mltG, partial [Thermoleophilia bacterium]|nr:mltG [Thermoleophilia bacterium]
MKLFGREEDRPEALEFGSSFADMGVATKARDHGSIGSGAYDARAMTNPAHGEPTTSEHRPIGSRRRDVAQPAGFGVAPSKPPKRGIVRRFIGFVIFLAILAAMAGGAWFAWTTFTSGSDIAAGKAVKVVIPNGASAGEVADVLAETGVVSNESMFRARLRLNGDGADFRSGTYTMKTGSSYDTVVRVLEKGPAAAPTFNLTLPEGTRIEETAALIEKMRDERLQQGLTPQPVFTGAQYLAAVKATPVPPQYKAPAKSPLEGFLFPATYELRLAATAQQFVDKQLAAFGDNFAQVSMANATAAKLSPYEVVTIASLIEREARIDSERPLVGAVI